MTALLPSSTHLINTRFFPLSLRCCDDLPSSASDLVNRVCELLSLFNSRTCQLILGAGALQLVGLKTITTKNLALASRCLQVININAVYSGSKLFAINLDSSSTFKSNVKIRTSVPIVPIN